MGYFDLKKSLSKVKSANGIADTLLSGAELVGKSAWNVGKWTITEGMPQMLEQRKSQAKKILNDKNSSEKQKENARAYLEKVNDYEQKNKE